MRNKNTEALNAADVLSPNLVRKKMEAPSLIPISLNEMGVISVFANIIKFPAHK